METKGNMEVYLCNSFQLFLIYASNRKRALKMLDTFLRIGSFMTNALMETVWM